jgi:hypothetical protein
MEYQLVSNTVTVACNLPAGIICEVGLELDYTLQRFVRTPKYRRVQLRGAQHARRIALPAGNQYVAARDLPPGLTPNVDLEFINEWLRLHPKMAQHVWVVESTKDVPHQVGDRPEAPFQPMDPTKPMRYGEGEVTRAEFNK